MKFTPIAARSVRWLSFVMAMTLAFQFVSPLVLADATQFIPTVTAADSGDGGVSGDDEQLEDKFSPDDLLPDDTFLPDFDELDSAFTFDSLPLRAPRVPGAIPSWHPYVKLNASIIGVAGANDIVLDSGTPMIPITEGTTKLKIHLDFGENGIPNDVSDQVKTGVAFSYVIKFSVNLIKMDVKPQPFTYIGKNQNTGEDVKIFHAEWDEDSSGAPIVRIWLDDEVNSKNLSKILGEYNLTLNLKPLAGQNPANPNDDKLIEVTDGPSFNVIPYETASTNPALEKSVSDDSKIVDLGHPIEWKLTYNTGRRTPDGVTPAYTPREIKIEDTIDTDIHTFDDTTLKWTNNDRSVTDQTVPLQQTGWDTKDQSKLPFYKIDGKKLTIYLPDTPNNTDPDKQWHTLTFKTNVTDTYYNNSDHQGKPINNTAKLSTSDNKNSGDKTASTRLPKWITKAGDQSLIDTDGVTALITTGPKMPIAWKITINPKPTEPGVVHTAVTIPSGTKLIDELPQGLWKIVSVREMTAPGTYKTLYAPDDSIGNSTPGDWTLTGDGTNLSDGTLKRDKTPSGTLTYTYPASVELSTTHADGKKTGKEQVFVVTALVDLQGLSSENEVQATFVNNASIVLSHGTYGAGAPPIGVSIDHSLLNKSSTWNDANRQITWTIDVNRIGATLNVPWVGDDIQNTQQFVDGSFTVTKKNGNAYEPYYSQADTPPGTGTLTRDSGGFDWTYDFDIAGTTTDVFQIQYKTYVPHPTEYPNRNGDKDGEKNGNESNIAVLHEGINKLIQVAHTQPWKSGMLKKSVVKYDPTPDPADTNANKRRLITWQVEVNPQGSFLKIPAFSDMLPEGLEYKAGTFTVKQGNDAAAAPTAGFAYNTATRELTYNFSQYIKKPGAHSPAVYYPEANADGIAGKFVLEFQTYVPESLWETSKTDKNAVDFTNKATLVCANTKATASANANIKAPTINKTGADKLLSEKVNGVNVAYFEWTVELNRNAAKLNEVTIVDELPEGLLLDYTLGGAFLPKLEAWRVSADGNKPPKFESKIEDIPLTSDVNSFYEPDPVRPNAYNLRIELNNLLAKYPNGCGFKLIYRALPTKGGVFNNTIKLEGLGANAHVGSDGSVSISDTQASGNASGTSGRLTVKKVTVEPDGTEASAKDVEFTLSITANSQKYRSLVTDDTNGTCLFNQLRFGGYTITETQAPEGYWIAPAATFTVNQTTSSADPANPKLFKNYANQIVVAKKDAISNQPLAGAQFQLYTEAGAKEGTVKTTDANGVCGWSKLAEGEYYIEEVAAPEGYKLSDAKKSVTFKISRTDLPQNAVLTGDATHSGGKYIDKTVDASWTKTPAVVFEFSNPRTGSVNVEKRDVASGVPLANAQFGLYEGSALLESKSTDVTGKLTFNTVLKDRTTYVVRELLAPEGYLMGGYTSAPFTTDFAQQTTEQRLYSFKVTNIKNLVISEKVSSTDAAKKLPGAVFGLYRADGTRITTATSDENGRFSFMGVPAGAYIQEITPPAGYQLNTTRYTPGLTAGSTENPPLYTFKNNPTPSGGGGGGGGGGNTPLLPPKSPSSSSSSSSASSGLSSSSGSSAGSDGGTTSSRPLPEEDENGQIHPGDLTPDEVGGLLDNGYRPTRDIPFGLTREEVIKMIIDENIPLGKLPATGDATGRVVFPLVLMAAASACITGLNFTPRKKRKEV